MEYTVYVDSYGSAHSQDVVADDAVSGAEKAAFAENITGIFFVVPAVAADHVTPVKVLSAPQFFGQAVEA